MLWTGHKDAIIKSLPEFAKDSTKPVKKRSGVSVSPDAVSHADRKITLFGKYTASISELEIKTVLLFSSKNPRDKRTYEKDTVREKLIDLDNYKSIKKSAKKIK